MSSWVGLKFQMKKSRICPRGLPALEVILWKSSISEIRLGRKKSTSTQTARTIRAESMSANRMTARELTAASMMHAEKTLRTAMTTTGTEKTVNASRLKFKLYKGE